MTLIPSAIAAFLPSCSLAPLPSPAITEELSYQFMHIGAGSSAYDGIDSDNLHLAVGRDLGDGYFAFVDVTEATLEGMAARTRLLGIAAGLGTHGKLQANVDLYGTLGFASMNLDRDRLGLSGANTDEDGLVLGLGLRALASSRVELALKADVYNVGDGDALAWRAESLIRWNESVALGIEYNHSSLVQSLLLGVRVYL